MENSCDYFLSVKDWIAIFTAFSTLCGTIISGLLLNLKYFNREKLVNRILIFVIGAIITFVLFYSLSLFSDYLTKDEISIIPPKFNTLTMIDENNVKLDLAGTYRYTYKKNNYNSFYLLVKNADNGPWFIQTQEISPNPDNRWTISHAMEHPRLRITNYKESKIIAVICEPIDKENKQDKRYNLIWRNTASPQVNHYLHLNPIAFSEVITVKINQ